MKIAYVLHSRFPTERGQGGQISHMLDSFISQGHSLVLFAPDWRQTADGQKIKKMGIKKYYNLKHDPVLSLQSGYNPTGHPLEMIVRPLTLLVYLAQIAPKLIKFKPDIIYTRDEAVAGVLGFLGLRTYYEGHFEPERASRIHLWFMRSSKGIIANTLSLKNRYLQLNNLKDKIYYSPNAISEFWLRQNKNKSLHKKLGLKTSAKFVCYAGNLYFWKGVDTLAQSIDHLPANTHIVILGGTRSEFRKLVSPHFANHPRIHHMSYMPQKQLANYLASASVLVLPTTSSITHAANYTSPLKLFEYLALKIPLVASQIPSITNLVSKSSVEFFNPDNSIDLAETINKVLKHPNTTKINRGYQIAKQHTWDKRAEDITNFINSKLNS